MSPDHYEYQARSEHMTACYVEWATVSYSTVSWYSETQILGYSSLDMD